MLLIWKNTVMGWMRERERERESVHYVIRRKEGFGNIIEILILGRLFFRKTTILSLSWIFHPTYIEWNIFFFQFLLRRQDVIKLLLITLARLL